MNMTIFRGFGVDLSNDIAIEDATFGDNVSWGYNWDVTSDE